MTRLALILVTVVLSYDGRLINALEQDVNNAGLPDVIQKQDDVNEDVGDDGVEMELGLESSGESSNSEDENEEELDQMDELSETPLPTSHTPPPSLKHAEHEPLKRPNYLLTVTLPVTLSLLSALAGILYCMRADGLVYRVLTESYTHPHALPGSMHS